MADLTSAGAGIAAAATWGAGDFAGGLATRRASVWRILLVSQTVGVVMTGALVLALAEGPPRAPDLVWGALAGASGAVGVAGLYLALARGRMGVAAPITAVVGAGLPVLVGILREGVPSPVALVGIAAALPGIWLLSRGDAKMEASTLPLAIASGLGFGGFFILLDQAAEGGIGWPLFAARLATLAAALVAVLVTLRRPAPPTPLGLAALAGVGDTGGNVFFVLATTLGRLDVAAVLASLYPAATVVLARGVLKEALTNGQWLGLGLTLGAIALIAGG